MFGGQVGAGASVGEAEEEKGVEWDWESNQAVKGGERESKTEGGKRRERRS